MLHDNEYDTKVKAFGPWLRAEANEKVVVFEGHLRRPPDVAGKDIIIPVVDSCNDRPNSYPTKLYGNNKELMVSMKLLSHSKDRVEDLAIVSNGGSRLALRAEKMVIASN